MINKRKTEEFECQHCNKFINAKNFTGSLHRNHCPYCLYSMHVDDNIAGDRLSLCQSLMKPIALTFKQEGVDKYGHLKQGELMLVHYCLNPDCQKININRIASDDKPKEIIRLFKSSLKLDKKIKTRLENQQINRLNIDDENELNRQLFGSQEGI